MKGPSGIAMVPAPRGSAPGRRGARPRAGAEHRSERGAPAAILVRESPDCCRDQAAAALGPVLVPVQLAAVRQLLNIELAAAMTRLRHVRRGGV